MSRGSLVFLLGLVGIFITFVWKHQMHQDLHMNFLEARPAGFAGDGKGNGVRNAMRHNSCRASL